VARAACGRSARRPVLGARLDKDGTCFDRAGHREAPAQPAQGTEGSVDMHGEASARGSSRGEGLGAAPE